MFDFAPVGGGVALAGIVFMLVFGSKLVKVRKQAAGSEGFDIERYLFEAKVGEDSDFVGQPVGELKNALEAQKMDLVTLQSKRQVSPVVNRRQLLRSGDILVLQGSQEDIDGFTTEHKFALVSAENSTRELLHSADSQMLEIVVTPRSPLVGRTHLIAAMASICLLPRALARPTEVDYATLSSAWAMCYCSTGTRTRCKTPSLNSLVTLWRRGRLI